MQDKELIERLRARDARTVRETVGLYNRRLFSMVYRVVEHKEDAEDVLQEAWLKFFNALDRFRGESGIYTYLYRIAMNEALMFLRKRKIKRVLLLDFREVPDERTPETVLLENERMRAVERGVRTLSGRQKQVFLLRRSEDLPFREIARILGIRENNAKVHYFHALQKLRKSLKKEDAL